MLLSTNLARERLQIDTAKHCWRAFRGTNIDDLERPWTPKIWVFSEFVGILGSDAEITGDRPRQPSYKIFDAVARLMSISLISCLSSCPWLHCGRI